jgi:hypothetical protein
MAATGSLALALAFSALLAAPAQAMQFKLLDTPDGRTTLVARGIIVPGDFTRLIGFVDTVPKAQRLALLVVDSPGGVVQEAGKMAVTIHNMGMPVAVAKRGLCASACVLLFAASPRRLVGFGARVGVHRASFFGGENKESKYATDSMAVHFENYGVPESIIAKVRATPPDGIAWLSDSDLRAMQATIYGAGDEAREARAEGGNPRH